MDGETLGWNDKNIVCRIADIGDTLFGFNQVVFVHEINIFQNKAFFFITFEILMTAKKIIW